MLTVKNIEVMNLEGAIRGMRNPMNSWDKNDSGFKQIVLDGHFDGVEYILGPNDLALAQKLVRAGSDHRKFMRQIFVSVDITAPLYWWKEFDTYKVGTVANSTSTMHTIHKKEFTLDDFSHEHLMDTSGTTADILGEPNPWGTLKHIVAVLNVYRNKYLQAQKNGADGWQLKCYWWQIIQLLPSSYNQLRTVTLNYENLLNIYRARRNHKLTEWHTFCEFIETLPYAAELITGGE